ncbi:ERAD-associated E3 ubiquitin-protein ligase component HRD3A [Euphorbia peplus]|nr:ERAD-associated E3 ubiquitin-protein ligase component HRD3A [Euphorbia peplus]
MLVAASGGEVRVMEEAVGEIEEAAKAGNCHAQSVLGLMRERNKGKSFVYHHFGADGGNMQSKMALAYTYSRQDVSFFVWSKLH